ncbi:hypothetical protein NC652_035708 [Populus alba x Populus x berolinensis]|nr:hypothetical protein NC652_035708 [Populus alba x Populus x berolinensis]
MVQSGSQHFFLNLSNERLQFLNGPQQKRWLLSTIHT